MEKNKKTEGVLIFEKAPKDTSTYLEGDPKGKQEKPGNSGKGSFSFQQIKYEEN